MISRIAHILSEAADSKEVRPSPPDAVPACFCFHTAKSLSARDPNEPDGSRLRRQLSGSV